MKIYFALIFLVAATIISKAKTSDCRTNPPDFIALSYEKASAAVNSELWSDKKICPEYITNLVGKIQQSQLTADNKVLAIYLLGALRPSDTNAIKVLIANIDFMPTKFDPPTRMIRWGQYPAEEALIKIGKPVIEPVLSRLPVETNVLRRKLMCFVLKGVAGKEDAQTQIKQKLADESDAIKRAHLESSLNELEKPWPRSGGLW